VADLPPSAKRQYTREPVLTFLSCLNHKEQDDV
jgi:hypothetical protein